jgi:hypothetical protein
MRRPGWRKRGWVGWEVVVLRGITCSLPPPPIQTRSRVPAVNAMKTPPGTVRRNPQNTTCGEERMLGEAEAEAAAAMGGRRGRRGRRGTRGALLAASRRRRRRRRQVRTPAQRITCSLPPPPIQISSEFESAAVARSRLSFVRGSVLDDDDDDDDDLRDDPSLPRLGPAPRVPRRPRRPRRPPIAAAASASASPSVRFLAASSLR